MISDFALRSNDYHGADRGGAPTTELAIALRNLPELTPTMERRRVWTNNRRWLSLGARWQSQIRAGRV
jgi:hypothetical protein